MISSLSSLAIMWFLDGCSVNLSLKEENRELFRNMINDCYKYAAAINAKGEPFPSEPLIMALLIST